MAGEEIVFTRSASLHLTPLDEERRLGELREYGKESVDLGMRLRVVVGSSGGEEEGLAPDLSRHWRPRTEDRGRGCRRYRQCAPARSTRCLGLITYARCREVGQRTGPNLAVPRESSHDASFGEYPRSTRLL